MTVGISAADITAILNLMRGSNATAWTPYIQLHTGDPGANGTANVSAVTTRNALTLNAPSAGQATLASLSDYAMTATEMITHVSAWDAASAGNFKRSIALTTGRSVVSGDTLHFTTLTIGYTPVAA